MSLQIWDLPHWHKLAVCSMAAYYLLHTTKNCRSNSSILLNKDRQHESQGRYQTEGFFTRYRNTNYLGEILIYTAFAMLAQHWLPFLIRAGGLMNVLDCCCQNC